MKIRVTTNIRSNTQKFSSVDELPPDIREMYERAVASGEGKKLISTTGPKIFTKLVINGREVDPTKAMSEAEQKVYADVIELLKKAPAPTTIAAPIADQSEASPTLTPTSVPPASSQQLVPAVVDTGWLTKQQWKLVLVVVVLAAAALTVAMALLSP